MAGLPVAQGVPSHHGVAIPEYFTGKTIVKFYDASVIANISNKDYEGEIKKAGDKVKIRTVPDITIRDYVKGAGLHYEHPEGGLVELDIDKGKYFAFELKLTDKVQSDLELADKWSDDASMQMKIRIDGDILADIYADAAEENAGATAGRKSGSINLGVTGSPITITTENAIDYLVHLSQVADEQNWPETERWIVLPAWYTNRIKRSELKSAALTGDPKSILRSGRIGMIDNWTIYRSNQVNRVLDGSAYCSHIVAGHMSALTFASQIVETETLKNPNDFGDLIRGLQVYGYEVVKPESMAVLYAKPGEAA